jgi:hypothetical protein
MKVSEPLDSGSRLKPGIGFPGMTNKKLNIEVLEEHAEKTPNFLFLLLPPVTCYKISKGGIKKWLKSPGCL